MSLILNIQKLNAFYGARTSADTAGAAQALFGINLQLQAGQAAVLQGANGAGKSTCLKAIMGLVVRRAAVLQVGGVDTTSLPVEAIADLGVGYVPEDRRIFTRLTVLENLRVAAPSKKPGKARSENQVWNEASVLDALPHLKTLLQRSGDAISGGEQRMVAVARALMRDPRLLLLDEPCEGVAPKVADAIESALHLALSQGAAVLLSESHDGFAQRLGAAVLPLHAGALV